MTEGFLPSRLPIPRLRGLLCATTLCVALGLGAHAAQPPNAGSPATPASSGVDTGGPRWLDLGPAQRKVLAPLAADWNGLDGRSKERWIDVAARFPKMPADEQQRANQRMGEWAHMSVAQRTQARMTFQESRSVSKEEREARWKAYQALPEEKKRELAKRAVAPAGPASAPVAQARRRAPPPIDAVQPKTNVVGNSAQARSPAGSAPLAAAARNGVTTTLITRRSSPPPHQRDGQPKIAAGPNSVDRKTLLPKHVTLATAGAAAASAPAADHR
jgi:hypothetical protein